MHKKRHNSHALPLKITFLFALIAAVIATLLLCLNFLGIGIIATDTDINTSATAPQSLVRDIDKTLQHGENGYTLRKELPIPADQWCILLNDNGDIVWSCQQPKDIPTHYDLEDIAKLSRWFLNDYPVYVHTGDHGLFIYGLPKNAVGKYQLIYSMDWFHTLPYRLIAIFLFNLLLALLLALIFGRHLYKRIQELSAGISDLKAEKPVHLKTKGIFKEAAANLNETAITMERKNEALALRDRARAHWIAGISHDIRTPLAVILGKAESMENDPHTSPEQQAHIAAIIHNTLKVKDLVADLNLVSSLEYDMQPAKKQELRVCPFLRKIVSEFLNSGHNTEVTLELTEEKNVISADPSLLARAITNLLQNAAEHNGEDCTIHIRQYDEGDSTVIIVADNGSGVPQEVLDRINILPETPHGLGLPLACRIIKVHGGTFTPKNKNGFQAEIRLPIKK